MNPIVLHTSCASSGIEQYICLGGQNVGTIDQSLREVYPLRLHSSTDVPPIQVSFSFKPHWHKYSGNSRSHKNHEVTANPQRS